MPCYERRFTTVDLAASNLNLLGAAFQELGYSIRPEANSIRAYKGSVTITFIRGEKMNIIAGRYADTIQMTKDIKVAYATESVKYASKRFGWKLQQKGNKFLATRKAF